MRPVLYLPLLAVDASAARWQADVMHADQSDCCCRACAPVPCPGHPTFDLLDLLQSALNEDAGSYGDLTSMATCILKLPTPPPRHLARRWCNHGLFDECRVPSSTAARATFLAKADGIVAGLAVAELVSYRCDNRLVLCVLIMLRVVCMLNTASCTWGGTSSHLCGITYTASCPSKT